MAIKKNLSVIIRYGIIFSLGSGIFLFWPRLVELSLSTGIKYLGLNTRYIRFLGDEKESILESLLLSENWSHQVKGLEALSHVNYSKQLIPAILGIVNSGDIYLSEQALNLLQKFNDPSLAAEIIKIGKSSNPMVRLGILRVLSQIPPSDEMFEYYMQYADDPNWIVRMSVCDLLFDLKDARMVAIYTKLIKDPVLEVAYAASLGLKELNERDPLGEVFEKLNSMDSWRDRFLGLKLISLYPFKIVSSLVAKFFIESDRYISLACMNWMKEFGDEKDFSLIIRKSGEMQTGIEKASALIALSHIANRIGKQNEVLLNALRFLKENSYEMKCGALESIAVLKGDIARDDIRDLISSDESVTLTALAVKALGEFRDVQDREIILSLWDSPHAEVRSQVYRALYYQPNVPPAFFKNQFALPQNEEELCHLMHCVLMHAPKDALVLFKEMFPKIKSKDLQFVLLEGISLLMPELTTLEIVKRLDKQDLQFFEKSKMLMDGMNIKLNMPAITHGYRAYLSRQKRDVAYSIMSFPTSRLNWWEINDTLYLKNNSGTSGMLEGIILLEDFNTVYFSQSQNEVVEMERHLIETIHYSALNALQKLKSHLEEVNKLYEKALDSEHWLLCGYFIQNAMVEIEMLSKELSHHAVARQLTDHHGRKWEQIQNQFRSHIEKTGLIEIGNRFTTLKKAQAGQLLEKYKTEADSRIREANQYFENAMLEKKKSQYAKAIDLLKQSIEIWPFSENSLKQLGLIYAELGHYEKAISFYENLRKQFYDDPNITESLAIVYQIQGDYESAIREYVRLIEIDPTSHKGYVALSQIYKQLENIDEALDILEGAIKIVNDLKPIHMERVRLYQGKQMYAEARNVLEEILRFRPDDVEALNYLGLTLFALGEETKAVHYLTKAIQYDLANVTARLSLAEIYLSQGKQKQALIELEKILAIEPSNRDAKMLISELKGQSHE